jgi:hypothetical protein
MKWLATFNRTMARLWVALSPLLVAAMVFDLAAGVFWTLRGNVYLATVFVWSSMALAVGILCLPEAKK